MKKIANFLVVFIFLLSLSSISFGQIEIDKKVEKETNEAIDDGFKKLKGVFKKKDKKKETQPETKKEKLETQAEQPQEMDISETPTEVEEVKDEKPTLVWSKYDFVPGEKVFFEDNQEGEENGEFPSRWDIKAGNVENAVWGGDNVIMFREDSFIIPFLENSSEDYLPDVFTLEFDCYFQKVEFSQQYEVYFYDQKNQKWNDIKDVSIYYNRIVFASFRGKYPGSDDPNANRTKEGWVHVAISFNKRALKVYMDDTRLINVPNITTNPTGITIWAEEHNEVYAYIKNIRLAEGGVKLYDKMMEDGKIVATGIRFDSGNATLKPESMGVINEVAELMQEHPDVNFSVEGHTDSDGDAAFNLQLSQERAQVVVNELVARGISADRLQAKGFGETNPAAPNTSPEGKANNRRVEFVKI